MGFGKDGTGVILRETQVLTLGALGNGASIKASSNLAITDDFRILKTEYFLASRGTIANGQYPIYIGICDNELTTTEINETLSVDGPLDRNDNAGHEASMRPVWVLEQAGQLVGTAEFTGPIHFKGEKNVRWTFSNSDGWTWFAYNGSGAALTTGQEYRIYAVHYGVWVS